MGIVPTPGPQVAAAGQGGVAGNAAPATKPAGSTTASGSRVQPQAGAGAASVGDDALAGLTVPGLVNHAAQEPPSREDAAGLQLPRSDPLFPVLKRVLQELPPPETERVLAPGKPVQRTRAQLGCHGRVVEDFDGLWRYVGGRREDPPPAHYRRLVITGGKVIDRNEVVSRIQRQGTGIHWYGRSVLLLSCRDRMVIIDKAGNYVRYERG